METRRDFIKKAALLSGAAGLSGILPPAIQRALAIDPELGSTFLDAEHVVIIMQENRSFDHTFGSLQGVRGFNDPRTISLPNKNVVWLQTNAAGETYAPFRLNIKDTKATWMGSLPHGWTDQVDARNEGKYDGWLEAKKSGHKPFANMPLTMGYYNRADIPFYYSLADAFTICDQNFCSSLTGTTPNRVFLWTGTIRDEQNGNAQARVWNHQYDYDALASWTTFPERLEDNEISWKIYQNEISVGVGFEGEEDAWLSNFTDNPIEWFTPYYVKFLTAYIRYLPKRIVLLSDEIKTWEGKVQSLSETSEEYAKAKKELQQKRAALTIALEDQKNYTAGNFEKLTQRERNLHAKAFVTNTRDPFYHELTTMKYHDGTEEREMKIPKGDVLHQFREDVKNGSLPAVSWLVAPENFSDHPGAPWYGEWYISEALDILTKNPDVWKKTIFILAYDENDGYFDHVPPFTAPNPNRPATGLSSKGIDTGVDFVTLEQDRKGKPEGYEKYARESSIGLGYRVPLVVASPWSRGGAVCSQVFDHTSLLQFLEKFLSHKTGKKIEESNISAWRRTVCGDLTSVFRPYQGEKITLPSFLSKEEFIQGVHKAQFKKDPDGFRSLTDEEIEKINQNPSISSILPKQEKGVRPSCALPYQLYADGKLSEDKKSFDIKWRAENEIFGGRAIGSAFNVYAPGKYRLSNESSNIQFENVRTWSYAVAAGDSLTDSWALNDFENEKYHLRVYGPNGFYREFMGNGNDPKVDIACEYESNKKKLTGNIVLRISNQSTAPMSIKIADRAYKSSDVAKLIAPAHQASIVLDLRKSFGWYDFSIKIAGSNYFEKRYAGRVETGKIGFTDPVLGH